MRYKLVAIDMDGTLLNSQDKVSDKTKDVLSKAIEKGIYIVLSTGRIYKSALHYGEYIGLNSPIIACNGAIISSGDGEKIIYENPINDESFKEVIQLAEENNIYYHFYDIDTFYYKKNNEFKPYYSYYEESLKMQGINLMGFMDPVSLINKKASKYYKIVLIENDSNKLIEFRKKLEENISGISVSKSWHNNIEVMNEGASKGMGLKYLIERLDIDSSQVVAIGDNENDISMFKVAGLAIAMKNGDDIIRKHANVITDTNDDDGVANAIEKYILNNK